MKDLETARYDPDSEATSRIAIDIILVQCRKHLLQKDTQEKSETNVADAANPSTLPNARAPVQQVTVFPESTLSIDMPNKSVSDGIVLVAGRADQALGYSTCGRQGALLIAIAAKQRTKFAEGEDQLLAYLAILRESRLREQKTNQKTNIATQGFYSDGKRFSFICISTEGTIQQSSTFNIEFVSELKIVFNFIVAMMETAIKSTPNDEAWPTLRERSNNFQEEA